MTAVPQIRAAPAKDRTGLFVEWTGRRVTALLEGALMGRFALADQLGVPVATVLLWERRPARRPVEHRYWPGLDQIYDELHPVQKFRVGRHLYAALTPPRPDGDSTAESFVVPGSLQQKGTGGAGHGR